MTIPYTNLPRKFMKKQQETNNILVNFSLKGVKRKPFRKTEKGFTLIEVLVAVIILGFAYVAILENFSVSMRYIVRIEKSRNHYFESMLAFEQQLDPQEDEEESEVLVEDDEPFLKGRYKYRLMPVRSIDGDFETLKLEEL